MAGKIIRIDEQTSNPKLKKAMNDFKAAFTANKKNATELLNVVANEFAGIRALAPVKLSGEPVSKDGVLTVPPESEVSFVLLTDKDTNYLPLFTENVEYAKWNAPDTQKPEHVITLDFAGIASLLEGNADCKGALIDPFDTNMMLPREMILKWYETYQIQTQGHARHVITNDTPAEVFMLSPYPMELSNKLCDTAKTLPGVNAMWLRGIRLNGDDGYLLIADLSEDGHNGIYQALGGCATPLLGGLALHIVSADSDFGKSITQNSLPFYSKNA